MWMKSSKMMITKSRTRAKGMSLPLYCSTFSQNSFMGLYSFVVLKGCLYI